MSEMEVDELADGSETSESSSNSDTSETSLSDSCLCRRYCQFLAGSRRCKLEKNGKLTSIDNTLLAEFVEETLGNFVGSVVLGDFLTENENGLVSDHLLLHS